MREKSFTKMQSVTIFARVKPQKLCRAVVLHRCCGRAFPPVRSEREFGTRLWRARFSDDILNGKIINWLRCDNACSVCSYVTAVMVLRESSGALSRVRGSGQHLKRRVWLQVQGLWFAAWSSRAQASYHQKWAYRRHSLGNSVREKFFQQINGVT